jgi:phage terminase small subunit
MNFRRPPKHLSKAAKVWWRLVFATYSMDESGSFLLRTALECFDRIDQAREAIATDGLVIEDPLTKQKRMHPCLRVEKEARTGLLAAWRMLHIDIEPPKSTTGRPPGGGGPRDADD